MDSGFVRVSGVGALKIRGMIGLFPKGGHLQDLSGSAHIANSHHGPQAGG